MSIWRAPLSSALGLLLTFAVVTGCGGPTTASPQPEPHAFVADSEDLVTITVVGTNDIHGAVARLPVLAGYVEILREQRRKLGGGVVLVDAGDMFQGTLESNMGEGRAIVELMNEMRYDASAVGNHEFDFGPVGLRATPKKQGDDPRGALKARAAEAKFPFLGANIFDRDTSKRVSWPNVPANHVVQVGSIKVGIIGLATVETPQTTIAANVVGLEFRPLLAAVVREATALRSAGVNVVVVTAHAGGICVELGNPTDLSSCQDGHEIFELAEKLPTGLVDVIVAGHTHRGVAHYVNGIPIIEQFANGQYFGRVDLAVGKDSGRVVDTRVHAPRQVCVDRKADTCTPTPSYEGQTVVVPVAVAEISKRWEERAKAVRDEPLGVVAETEIPRSRVNESVMGNWVADLMLAARPGDVAITNGGGLRSNIGAGPITYGELYRVLPFDNRFAIVQMTGAELERAVAANLGHDGGILSLSGLTAEASCKGATLDVVLRRADGRVVGDSEKLKVITSDFLATTGKEFVGSGKGKVRVEDEPTIRDAVTAVLRKRKGTVSAADSRLLNPVRPRISYKGERPLSCK